MLMFFVQIIIIDKISLENGIQICIRLCSIPTTIAINVRLMVIRRRCDDTNRHSGFLVKDITILDKSVYSACSEVNRIRGIERRLLLLNMLFYFLRLSTYTLVIQCTYQDLASIISGLDIPTVEQICMMVDWHIQEPIPIVIHFQRSIFGMK